MYIPTKDREWRVFNSCGSPGTAGCSENEGQRESAVTPGEVIPAI